MFRRQNRRRPSRPAIKFDLPPINWRAIAVTVAAAAAVAGAWPLSAWLLNRPMETIVINGAFQRVSPMQLEALVEPYARSGFLEVDLGAIRRELTALPWVASAEVRRRWPDTLEIHVREETPVACWGERGLLNADGELFLADADHVPAELPRLRGPAGTEAQVTARYFAVQEQLEHRGLAAVALVLDARGAWTFTTSSGLQVRLGANGVDERMARFFEVLDGPLAQLAADLEYVDMRYPNGFAVGWKNTAPARAAAKEGPRPHA